MIFVGYPRCSTSNKAQKWMDDRHIPYTFRHIKEDHPTVKELKAWREKSGQPLKKFFNTSGMLYRELRLKERLPELSEEEQLELLASDGLLVKRPILVGEDFVLIGFKEVDWAAKLK